MVIANKALTTNFSKNKLHIAVTYHPGLKNISQIINKNWHLLYMDQEVKSIYTKAHGFFP